MAFDRTSFATSDLGMGSSAPKQNSYKTTTDNKAAVVASGYFNDIAEQLTAGDFIMVSASDGDAIVSVNAVTSGVVTTLSVALA